MALRLHRASRAVVLPVLLPSALGLALAVATVALAVVLLGVVVDQRAGAIVAGTLLIAWALCHGLYGGGRQRPRFGHRAGLMLVPVLIPLCLAAAAARATTPCPAPPGPRASRRSRC